MEDNIGQIKLLKNKQEDNIVKRRSICNKTRHCLIIQHMVDPNTVAEIALFDYWKSI